MIWGWALCSIPAKFFGLGRGNVGAVFDLLQDRIAAGKFLYQGFDHLAVTDNADRLIAGTEFHHFLMVQHIGQIEMDRIIAGVWPFAKSHQRAKFFGQFIQACIGAGGPIMALLRVFDQALCLATILTERGS